MSGPASAGWTVGILLLGLLGSACSPEPPEVPSDLIGRWRTNAPGYEDRTLSIRPGWIEFGTGGLSRQAYRLERVEPLPAIDEGRTVRLHLRERTGEASSLDLTYREAAPAQLRFVHRPQVWLRADPPREPHEDG